MYKPVTFLLVRPGRVVVVQVVEKVDTAVEGVEEASAQAYPPVQELDGAQHGAGENVFEPGQAGIRDGHTQQEDQVLEGCSSSSRG